MTFSFVLSFCLWFSVDFCVLHFRFGFGLAFSFGKTKNCACLSVTFLLSFSVEESFFRVACVLLLFVKFMFPSSSPSLEILPFSFVSVCFLCFAFGF